MARRRHRCALALAGFLLGVAGCGALPGSGPDAKPAADSDPTTGTLGDQLLSGGKSPAYAFQS
jgi:hypothetical protein